MENSTVKKIKPWKFKLEILHRRSTVQMVIQGTKFWRQWWTFSLLNSFSWTQISTWKMCFWRRQFTALRREWA